MQPLYLFGKTCVQPFMKILCPTFVYGKRRKKNIKPVILTSNHLSGMDVLLVGINHTQQMHVLAKKEFEQKRFMRWIMRNVGAVCIDRGKPDIGAMRKILNYLKAKKTVCIFPEGTRNKRNRKLQRVLGGTAMFAIKAQSQIVPIAIWRHTKMFRKNYIVVGDPYELREFYGERINSETLMKADVIVREKMIEVKRMVDYFAILRGKAKRTLKKELKNEKIPFGMLYEKYKDKFLSIEDSVEIEDDVSDMAKKIHEAD